MNQQWLSDHLDALGRKHFHWPGTVSSMSDLLTRLSTAVGLYRGTGDGPETGPFAARVEVRTVVNGQAALLDYETVSQQGVHQIDHVMVTNDERDRPHLHVVSAELPGVVEFIESEPGTFASFDPVKAKIRINLKDGELSYSWWWSRDDGPVRAQTEATLRRQP